MSRFFNTSIPNFQIRYAERGDAPQLLEFIRELAAFEKLLHAVGADVETLERNIFDKRYAEVVLGELEGRPVSFALFFHTFSTFLGAPSLYLEDLYVQPHARSLGIGTALLGFLAALAVERGCGRMEWSVLNWNAGAIALYQRLGAAPMDDWTVYRLSGAALQSLASSFEGMPVP